MSVCKVCYNVVFILNRDDDHEGILNYFPKAEFQYIEDAGHWVHAEKPAEFLDLVCEFLNRI